MAKEMAKDLAEQMALYAVGQRALEAGDLAAAGSAFQEYLEAWPDGTLREEVLVSILEVLVRQQAWAEADALAASLMTVPTLSLRVGELTRVRAEALVHLGRCSDAMALVSGLEKADATKLRKACMR